MAKKAKKKKPLPFKGKKKGSATKPAAGRQASKPPKAPRERAPRSQVLPGMEQVTDSVLNDVCEGIADARSRRAEANTDEANEKDRGLRRMQDQGVDVYDKAGVTLVRVKGSEELIVKKSRRPKTTSNAAPNAAADVDNGAGDDDNDEDLEAAAGDD